MTHRDTNAVRSVETTDDGQYVVTALPPGPYRLELTRAGFKAHVEEFVLFVSQDLRVDVALQVGAPSEQVVVLASSIALERDSTAVGTIVENAQVVNLPLDGRNFLELALLVPGTAPAAQGSASSVRGDFAFTAAGGREDANGFLLDGVDNVDPKLNTPAVRPPVDAIREFEVLTSSYEPEIGRYGAGQVNVVLKSGTNSLRGTGYGFFRNGALDARNFFAPRDEPAPDYRRNQFGGSVGGPISRDRLFFFADYEGTRITEGITQVTNVPTAAERAGDFSQSVLPPPINFFTGQPFPGDRLPSFFQNPIGQAIAGLYPLPNRNVAARQLRVLAQSRGSQRPVRRAHRSADGRPPGFRHATASRTGRSRAVLRARLFAACPATATRSTGGPEPRGVGFSVITPRLLNEARFGYTRVANQVNQEGQGTSINHAGRLARAVGEPARLGSELHHRHGLLAARPGVQQPAEGHHRRVSVRRHADLESGAHLVKAGFDLRAVRQDAFRDVQARGQLTFTPFAYTGNGLADLLLGLPTITVGAALDNPQRLRTENLGLFVQDQWRATSTLTLTAGVRYELTSPPVDADDRATIYDPATGTLVESGTDGVPRAGYDTNRNNFAPRLGVAWSAAPKRWCAARYGIYYNQSALAPSEGLYFSAPYFHLDFFFPAQGLPPLTLYDPFPAELPASLAAVGLTFQRDLKRRTSISST